MNQFFYQITRKASELINSDNYRERNITKQTAFTRNRKLTFPVMIVLLLNFLTRTNSVTKQAFFKARKNILPDAFKELFERKKHLNYSNYLREVMPEVNRSVRLPAPLHSASIIEEYLLLVKHR